MIALDDLKTLLEQDESHVLSLYLQVDPALQENQAATPAWMIYAKNALRDIRASVGDEQRDLWASIEDRVTQYLDGMTVNSKGLVLIVGSDFVYDYTLPVRPAENLVKFGKPIVGPLLWLMDEYERYLVVLVDQEEAHFLSTYLGEIGREEAMASDRFTFDFREKTLNPRAGMPGAGSITQGSNRDEFDDQMDEWIARFHRDVAQRISELMEKLDAKRVVIGGNEKTAHAVKGYLPQPVADAVVGILGIPFHESDAEVMARVLPLALDYERQKEGELVDFMIDQAKAGGRGALGIKDVELALAMQRVQTLVVSWPTDDLNRLEELSLKTLRSNSQVELVHGAPADRLNAEGGVGAVLYYAL